MPHHNDDGWISISGTVDSQPPSPKKPRKERRKRNLSDPEHLFLMGNLNLAVNVDDLTKVFKKYGTVKEILLNCHGGVASMRMETMNPKHMVDMVHEKVICGSRISLRHIERTTVKVGNLPSMVSNELLKEAFTRFGQVERAVVIVDRDGKATTRGIVEFESEESAKAAVQQTTERSYIITSSPRPVIATLMEYEDSQVGMPEHKLTEEYNYYLERSNYPPRFPVPESFEDLCSHTWKVRLNVESAQKKQFESIQQESRNIFQTDVEGASCQNHAPPPNKDLENMMDEKRSEFVKSMHLQNEHTINPIYHAVPPRFDGMNHWLVKQTKQRKCAVGCSAAMSVYICEKCDVGLHPECHKRYHQRDEQMDEHRRVLLAYQRSQEATVTSSTQAQSIGVKEEVQSETEAAYSDEMFSTSSDDVELVSSDNEDNELAILPQILQVKREEADSSSSSDDDEGEGVWQVTSTVKEIDTKDHLLNDDDDSGEVAAAAGPSSARKARKKELKVFKCNYCLKVYSRQSHLHRHMQRHEKDELVQHICEKCDKSFPRKDSYKRHMLIHSGEKFFHCRMCNRGFAHKYLLDRHGRSHSDDKQFKCHICPQEPAIMCKSFKTQDSYRRHMRAHELGLLKQDDFSPQHLIVIRPHACPTCGKRFKKRSHMTRHMLIHTKQTPFKCTGCERGFTRRYQLTKHLLVCETQLTQLHRDAIVNSAADQE